VGWKTRAEFEPATQSGTVAVAPRTLSRGNERVPFRRLKKIGSLGKLFHLEFSFPRNSADGLKFPCTTGLSRLLRLGSQGKHRGEPLTRLRLTLTHSDFCQRVPAPVRLQGWPDEAIVPLKSNLQLPQRASTCPVLRSMQFVQWGPATSRSRTGLGRPNHRHHPTPFANRRSAPRDRYEWRSCAGRSRARRPARLRL
jgi:hypothetical protein